MQRTLVEKGTPPPSHGRRCLYDSNTTPREMLSYQPRMVYALAMGADYRSGEIPRASRIG